MIFWWGLGLTSTRQICSRPCRHIGTGRRGAHLRGLALHGRHNRPRSAYCKIDNSLVYTYPLGYLSNGAFSEIRPRSASESARG
jgi:hypothetical protein